MAIRAHYECFDAAGVHAAVWMAPPLPAGAVRTQRQSAAEALEESGGSQPDMGAGDRDDGKKVD